MSEGRMRGVLLDVETIWNRLGLHLVQALETKQIVVAG